MSILKPPHLREGDIVGLPSPSSSIAEFPMRTERSIDAMRQIGLIPRLGEHALAPGKESAGTPEERAADIHAFFLDPAVKGIVCTTGGNTSAEVLPLLDYDLIRQNPKVFCGFSDITALLLGIYKKTSMVMFHGPTLLPSFGDVGGIHQFTLNSFQRACFSAEPQGILYAAKAFSNEYQQWEKEDNRPPAMKPASPPVTVCGGSCEGPLMGGNFPTLCGLAGTDFVPDFAGSLLFLEAQTPDAIVLRKQFETIERMGVLDGVAGMIFGRFSQETPDSSAAYKVIKEVGERHGLPVLADIDCGHTRPMFTLPIGVHAQLNATEGTLTLPDAAVL